MKKFLYLLNHNVLKKTKHVERPLITISREKGSGGKPIAYLIAEKLGHPWKVYHQDTLEQIVAHQEELSNWLKSQINQENRRIVHELIQNKIGDRYNGLNQYHKDLITLLASIGIKGHSIIVGRGAHYLFPDALKVRLICKIEQRIEWLMKYEHVSYSDATRLINESDSQRENFIKGLFGHDHRIPYHYDIILKTSQHIKLEDAAATIAQLAKRRFRL